MGEKSSRKFQQADSSFAEIDRNEVRIGSFYL